MIIQALDFSSLTEILKCKEEKDSTSNSISSKNIKVKQNRKDKISLKCREWCKITRTVKTFERMTPRYLVERNENVLQKNLCVPTFLYVE